MQFVLDRDDAAYSARSGEIAFLANVILAGCSIQARPFTAQEAWDGAVAVCNLGLENWPAEPEDFLMAHDLVSVFQVGWSVLYRDVCLYSAERLVSVLTRVRSDDHEVQADLNALRTELARHWRDGAPWRAHNALDVIAILDMPSWAVLLGLTGEYPVMHAGIDTSRRPRTLAVSSSAFEFISENSQMATVREFLESLPERLSP
jgi:hypothetical protein